MKKINYMLTVLLLFHVCKSTAQKTEWNLLILQKGQSYCSKKYDYMYTNTGFYLYKNCYYDFIMADGNYSGKFVDIKPDTITFSHCTNHYTLEKWDTIVFPTSHIKQILIAGRNSLVSDYVSLKYYDLIYEKDSANRKRFESAWLQIYRNDSNKYEIVKYMQSYAPIDFFEMEDKLYYFDGTGQEKREPYPINTEYKTKRYIWFIPCAAEKINGIALGIAAENIKYQYHSQTKDSLEINGLSITTGEIDPFGYLYLAFKSTPYQVDYERVRKQRDLIIKGLSVSGLGIVNEANIQGMNLSGINTTVYELHGCSITGLSTFSYVTKGVSISALKNISHALTGLQIGLYNKSKRTKGVQVGLWNVNEKRKLPLINWNF